MYHIGPGRTQISCNKTIKEYNKPTIGLGFMEMIHLPRLGFLRGVFLANHLASNNNLTRTTKRQGIPTKINNI